MDMKAILQAIEQRLDELKLKPATVSRDATGSPDTIRNWQRAVKDGHEPGGTVKSLLAVADAVGLEIRVADQNGQMTTVENSSESRAKVHGRPCTITAKLCELFAATLRADEDVQLEAVQLLEELVPSRHRTRVTKTKEQS